MTRSPVDIVGHLVFDSVLACGPFWLVQAGVLLQALMNVLEGVLGLYENLWVLLVDGALRVTLKSRLYSLVGIYSDFSKYVLLLIR